VSRLSITVAGYTIASESSDVDFTTFGAVSRFTTTGLAPDLELIVRARTPLPAEGVQQFDSGGLWRLFESDDQIAIALESEVFTACPYAVIRLDRDLRFASLDLDPSLVRGRPVYPLDYPLDEVLLGLLIAKRGGVEFHCAGIIDEHENGHLFVAQSETGKTTTANLWLAEVPGCEVISDDRVIIRQDLSIQPQMFGTPWHGDGMLASARSVNLQSITLLRQSPENQYRVLSGAEATARLLTCCFPPFYDPDAMGRTIDEIQQLTTKVRVGELGFVPNASAVHFVRERLGIA